MTKSSPTLVLIETLLIPRYNPMMTSAVPSYLQNERGVTRSPVNFREGRRSSDGLVAQGLVAFQQRLYEKEMATGVLQLHQVEGKVSKKKKKKKLMEFSINNFFTPKNSKKCIFAKKNSP